MKLSNTATRKGKNNDALKHSKYENKTRRKTKDDADNYLNSTLPKNTE